jgi:hypothetical protein
MEKIRKKIEKNYSEMGSKGGLARGACKVRGDSEHYKKLSLLAAEARKKKYGNKEK